MDNVKKIMWPTDASNSAIKALDAAIFMADTFDAEIHAFQVIEILTRPNHVGFAGDPLSFDVPQYEQHMVEAAQKNLEELLAQKIPKAIRAEAHVELGSPREMIQMFCRDNGIDLIVMATHGREGLSHLMLGSIAEATIRQSPVPVLVIPQHEE